MDEVKLSDVKALLGGDGNTTDANPHVIETRNGSCAQHGDYLDQRTTLRSYVGLKPIAMPYWLGCPECRRLMDQGNKQEAKQWTGLIPGEPSWTIRR